MSGFSLQDEVKATQLENNRVMHRFLPAASGTIRIWNRTSKYTQLTQPCASDVAHWVQLVAVSPGESHATEAIMRRSNSKKDMARLLDFDMFYND